MDFIRAFKVAKSMDGRSDASIHHIFDMQNMSRSSGQHESRFFKEFKIKNGKAAVTIISHPQSLSKSLGKTQPYYEGLRLREGKGWHIDPSTVPTSKPNIARGGRTDLKYPYAISIYLGAPSNGNDGALSNERVATIQFSNLKDMLQWGNFINPQWKY